MKVGLVMIVKDEEAVIERALLSAKPFISTYVIVDTGSTDHTKEIIASVMSDISGAVIDRPWVSFGHNRSEALALCDGQMDWAIMFDADDSLAGTVPEPSTWQTDADGFTLTCIHSSVRHQRTQIFRMGLGWAYEGALHEYAICRSKHPKQPTLAALPPETYLITRCEGSRSKDPEKYLKDAQLLEKELLDKPDDHRTLFYLAQSYRDAGRNEEARRYYQRNIDVVGGWDQERYITLMNLIILTGDNDVRKQLTWQAIGLCPERLDAQYTYLNMRRTAGLEPTAECYAIATFTKNRKVGSTDLFVMPHIYEWGMDDELATVAFKTGHFRKAYKAAIRCLMIAPESLCANALKIARAAYLNAAERL